MIKIIIVCIFMLSIESLYGQGFQVGLRTGENNWSRVKKVYNGRDMVQRINWTKEIFARYEIKRFGFEIGVSQYYNSAYFIDSPYIIFDVYPSPDKVQYYFHQNVWDFMTRIQYKLDVFTVNTVAQHKITGKKSIISDYIGMNAGITRVYKKETTDYTFSDDPAANIYKRSAYDHTTDIHMGISNTLSIAVSKHFVVRNTISAYANPFTLFSRYPYKPEYNANTTFQCSFSVGYLFK